MFLIFIWACRKYKFSFTLSTHGQTAMMLNPNNAFEHIYINQSYYDNGFNTLFSKAIKEMKRYRKERGY
jgi:hypothetical protein